MNVVFEMTFNNYDDDEPTQTILLAHQEPDTSNVCECCGAVGPAGLYGPLDNEEVPMFECYACAMQQPDVVLRVVETQEIV